MKITCLHYTHISMQSISLKIFNTYNIFDKLKYRFNIVTTYVSTDEVYSDDHHSIIVTVVYTMNCHIVYTATNLITP